MADLGGELVEVPALNGLQPVCDTIQRRVGRGVVANARDRTLSVGPVALEGRFMQSTA